MGPFFVGAEGVVVAVTCAKGVLALGGGLVRLVCGTGGGGV